jgi:hypothetical protein
MEADLGKGCGCTSRQLIDLCRDLGRVLHGGGMHLYAAGGGVVVFLHLPVVKKHHR